VKTRDGDGGGMDGRGVMQAKGHTIVVNIKKEIGRKKRRTGRVPIDKSQQTIPGGRKKRTGWRTVVCGVEAMCMVVFRCGDG
jgi:hypothetical protein